MLKQFLNFGGFALLAALHLASTPAPGMARNQDYVPTTQVNAQAWPNAEYEAQAFNNVVAELDPEEEAQFRALYQQLQIDHRIVLLDFTERLPIGDRGILALALLNSDDAGRFAILGLFGFLNHDARQMLATQSARRFPRKWGALIQYARSTSYTEIAWSLLIARPQTGCPVPAYPGSMDWTSSEAPIVEEAVSDMAAEDPLPEQTCSDTSYVFMTDWHRQTPRVVNGRNVSPGDAPWQAQLIRSAEGLSFWTTPRLRRAEIENYGEYLPDWENRHICGGVYLGDRWVVTAAHCISGWSSADLAGLMRIRLGTTDAAAGGAEYEISAAVVHAQYGGRNGDFRNDIALLRLASPVRSRRVRRATPAAAPYRRHDYSGPLELTGWGLTSATTNTDTLRDLNGLPMRYNRILQSGNLYLRDSDTCGNSGRLRGVTIWPGQICAGSNAGVDACRGDSGGPLVRRRLWGRELVGIVSYGAGCGLSGTAKIFVDIGYYNAWIGRAMNHAREGSLRRLSCSTGSDTSC